MIDRVGMKKCEKCHNWYGTLQLFKKNGLWMCSGCFNKAERNVRLEVGFLW